MDVQRQPASEIVDTLAQACAVHDPVEQTAPAVIGVPHAGRQYPRRFLDQARLSAAALRRSEDAYVDMLTEAAVALGAPQLCARFPRAYLDVNREPYELDPRMFDGRLPPFINTRSMRVAGGLGTIPRIVGDGQEIYRRAIPAHEALHRIETLYRPYHAALRGLVNRTRDRFGHCILLDAHSMPSVGLDREAGARPDIILGDRFGTSAAAHHVDEVEAALRRVGFNVTRNRPYAGGYITEHYGQPRSHVHAIQIELNRSLYMNEGTLAPLPRFADVKAALTEAFTTLFALWRGETEPFRQAAE